MGSEHDAQLITWTPGTQSQMSGSTALPDIPWYTPIGFLRSQTSETWIYGSDKAEKLRRDPILNQKIEKKNDFSIPHPPFRHIFAEKITLW